MKIGISSSGVMSTLGFGNRSLNFSEGLPQSNISHCQVRYQSENFSQKILSVPDFHSHPLLAARGIKFLTRGTQLLFIASHEVMGQLSSASINSEDLGIVIGSNYSSLEVITNYDWTTISEGPSFVSVMDVPNTLLNAPASQIAIKHCAKAFNSTISSGRCASLDAIGYAAFFLEQKRGNYALAGGLEELNPTVLWQLNHQLQNQSEQRLFGEAAAMVFLDATHDFPSQALLTGWTNYWAPHLPLNEVVKYAVQDALDQAGLSIEDIGMVALGVGSFQDQDLINGIEAVLVKKTNPRVKAFSLNPIIGETIGASGAMHLIATLSAFKNEILPPTLGIENIDWGNCFEVSSQAMPFQPCPTLIVEMDHSGGASVLVITPPEKS